MAFENQAKLYCWQIAQIIIGLILDNFGVVGFLFFSPIPVDSSHVCLHFDNREFKIYDAAGSTTRLRKKEICHARQKLWIICGPRGIRNGFVNGLAER
jgi:hypothetical protein